MVIDHLLRNPMRKYPTTVEIIEACLKKIGSRMPFSEVNALAYQIEENISSSFTFIMRSRDMIFELSGGLPISFFICAAVFWR
jgi:hypothetical protein